MPSRAVALPGAWELAASASTEANTGPAQGVQARPREAPTSKAPVLPSVGRDAKPPRWARHSRTRITNQSNGAVQTQARPATSRSRIEPVRMACCSSPDEAANAPIRMPPAANVATKPAMVSRGSTLLRPAVVASTIGNIGRMQGEAMVAMPAAPASAYSITWCVLLLEFVSRELALPVWGRPAPETPELDQVDLDVDVAAGGLGVRAGLVCGVHKLPGDIARQARQADVEARAEEVGISGVAEIHLGVDGAIGGGSDLQLGSRQPDRAEEAGRPARAKQLLRVGAGTGTGRRKLDVQPVVGAARLALAAAGGVGLARVEHFFDLVDHGDGSCVIWFGFVDPPPLGLGANRHWGWAGRCGKSFKAVFRGYVRNRRLCKLVYAQQPLIHAGTKPSASLDNVASADHALVACRMRCWTLS